jgi:hypothetical protein
VAFSFRARLIEKLQNVFGITLAAAVSLAIERVRAQDAGRAQQIERAP